MKVVRTNKNHVNLNHLPELYNETKDLGRVAEEIWPFLMQMPYSFVRDVDVKNDFLLHFYEHLPLFFETYQRYKHSPFTPFLVRYSKNLFNNFIRHYRRRQISESRFCETFIKRSERDSFYSQDSSAISNSRQTLDDLPMEHRLITKLYFGLELNLEELKFLVGRVKSPQQVADFLTERRHRKGRKGKKKKSKAKKTYADNCNIRELGHLAEFFSVSKSTIFRRLETSLRSLYQEEN